jgi:hypothetical protein
MILRSAACGLAVALFPCLVGCSGASAPQPSPTPRSAAPPPAQSAAVAASPGVARVPRTRRAELRPSSPDAAPLHVVATGDGSVDLAHFDRTHAIMIADRRIFVLDGGIGVATSSAIRLPSEAESATTELLAGDWRTRRLWLETTPDGTYRAAFATTGVTWKLEAQPILRQAPVFFRGAWMSLEQPAPATQNRSRPRFVNVDGNPRAQPPSIEKHHLVIDYETQGEDLWAVVLPPGDNPQINKVVRWRAAGGVRWSEVTLPARRGSIPKPRRVIPSNGSRLYVEATVPRLAGIDPKGEEWEVSIPHFDERPHVWTETTRDIVARFDGKTWTLLEPPEGTVETIEEDPDGGIYVVAHEKLAPAPQRALLYKAPGAASRWSRVDLPEIRLVDVDEARFPTTFESLYVHDVTVRDGLLWIVAGIGDAQSSSDTYSRNWADPIAPRPVGRWALLRTKPVEHLVVLGSTRAPAEAPSPH